MDPSEESSAASPRTILVVEDEVLVRSTTAESLRDLGFAVIEAEDASEAVAVFMAHKPVDVVFTDWRMPGEMDGFGLARWVHQHHPEVKILMASGNRNPSGSTASLPCEAFFAKPYRLDAVAARIRSLLEQPH
jgi:CheY-like chemotaxis protein